MKFNCAQNIRRVLDRIGGREGVARFVKFGVVGFSGYIVNALFLQLFTGLHFPEALAWACATELATINNFTFNNFWVFKGRRATTFYAILGKFLKFNLTSAGALLIMTVVGPLATMALGTQYRQLILPAIILFLVMPYNYAMYSLVIWRKKSLQPAQCEE